MARLPLAPGEKYGEWTVIARAQKKPRQEEPHYTCRCSCGRIADVRASSLRHGLSKRCSDCMRRRLSSARKRGEYPK